MIIIIFRLTMFVLWRPYYPFCYVSRRLGGCHRWFQLLILVIPIWINDTKSKLETQEASLFSILPSGPEFDQLPSPVFLWLKYSFIHKATVLILFLTLTITAKLPAYVPHPTVVRIRTKTLLCFSLPDSVLGTLTMFNKCFIRKEF